MKNNFIRKKIGVLLLASILLFNSSIASSVNCNAATSTGVTLKDVTGKYLINKGVATGFKFNSSKIKLYKDLSRKDSYSTYLKKLSCSLDNYCYKQNIKSVELLFLDCDIAYNKDFWKEPNFIINSSTVMGATCNINYDWKGIIYTRITDKNNKVTINKSNGVIVDNSCPNIKGVINKYTYDTNTKVTISDDLSGIKKVVLNKTAENGDNLTIELDKENYINGITFDANGEYEIIVTDKSGNASSCVFTIQKK